MNFPYSVSEYTIIFYIEDSEVHVSSKSRDRILKMFQRLHEPKKNQSIWKIILHEVIIDDRKMQM